MLSLTVDAATLLLKLAQTARFASKPNSGSPIRDCVLITTSSEGVTLHASDAALGFTSSEIPAVIKEQGTICIPATAFLAAVKAVGTGAVTLQEVTANRMIVRAPGVSYTLLGMPANEYPVRQPVDETAGLTFAAADLATALGIVGPNIPGDDNRYGLSGIHMELYDGRARFVATDGNRLAWAEAPAVGTMDLPRQSLIGRAGVVALANLLGTANLTGTDVIFAPGGKYIEIRTDVGTMHAQFITADFPDYRQVLPGKLGTTMTANRLDLLRAIDRVLPFAGGTIPEVLLTLPDGDAGESELTMTTSKLDSGNSLVTLAIEATGPAMKVNLNGKYLRDALITMDCDEVTLGFSGILSPAIVVPKGTPATGGKSARINVIMPVRAS